MRSYVCVFLPENRKEKVSNSFFCKSASSNFWRENRMPPRQMVTNILSDLVLLSSLQRGQGYIYIQVLSQYCKNNRRVRWSVTVLSTRLAQEKLFKEVKQTVLHRQKKDDAILKGLFCEVMMKMRSFYIAERYEHKCYAAFIDTITVIFTFG